MHNKYPEADGRIRFAKVRGFGFELESLHAGGALPVLGGIRFAKVREFEFELLHSGVKVGLTPCCVGACGHTMLRWVSGDAGPGTCIDIVICRRMQDGNDIWFRLHSFILGRV